MTDQVWDRFQTKPGKSTISTYMILPCIKTISKQSGLNIRRCPSYHLLAPGSALGCALGFPKLSSLCPLVAYYLTSQLGDWFQTMLGKPAIQFDNNVRMRLEFRMKTFIWQMTLGNGRTQEKTQMGIKWALRC